MSEDIVKMSNHISTFYQMLYSKEDDDGNIRLFLESIKADSKRIDRGAHKWSASPHARPKLKVCCVNKF